MCFDLREWHGCGACRRFHQSLSTTSVIVPCASSQRALQSFFCKIPSQSNFFFVGCSNLSIQGRNTIQPISVVWRHSTPSRHNISLSGLDAECLVMMSLLTCKALQKGSRMHKCSREFSDSLGPI